jgi:hypothetical protein
VDTDDALEAVTYVAGGPSTARWCKVGTATAAALVIDDCPDKRGERLGHRVALLSEIPCLA